MARRRKSGSGGASMDSLLDTMTNVVGILVIMLVVTQLGVQDAVKRITGLVTEEELATAQQDAADLKALLELELERDRDLQDQLPDARLRLADSKAFIEELKKRIAEAEARKLDPNALAKQLEEVRAQEQSLAQRVSAKSAEISSLKARLDATPAGPVPDAKIVNLPNPRPAPPKAEAVEYLVTGGRVYPIEGVEELQKKARDEIATAARKLDIARDEKDPELLRIDAEKLKKHFDDKFVGDRTFRIRVAIRAGKPELILEPRESAGIETRRVESGFGRLIAKYRGQPNFLRFRVYSDSFETYIAARNAADRVEVAAGWIPYTANGQYRVPLGGKTRILVAGYTPPPPRPRPPVDPNAPVKPKPPSSDID